MNLKTNQTEFNLHSQCNGDYGLITEAYKDDPYGDAQCLIPHTVMKHTVYFHCGPSTTDPIIDSLSWLYDNTRGIMRKYPFFTPISSKSQETILINSILDVAFRPTFHDYPFPSHMPYYPPLTSNGGVLNYYDSGLNPNGGSVDFFPPSEAYFYWNICGIYPFYYKETNPQTGELYSYHATNTYISSFVHPAPYSLLDAPLLNCRVKEYAGYKSNHDTMAGGIYHTYIIEQPFDLSIINPSEKTIYNPSHVLIECNLTFPCYYKFLTLHGKYPDKDHEVLHGDYSKEYWDTIDDFEFEYDRDYPVPVNCTTNSSCTSEYILGGGITLTLQPPIIIMDAHFRGTSTTNKTTIHYNPNRTYGNWTYDTASIELDSNIATLPVCTNVDPNIDSIGNKSAFKGNSIIDKPIIHLKILNSLTQHPKIQVNLKRIQNARIRVFDLMGNIKQTEIINSNNQSVDCSLLKPGVYHAVLINNGEVIDKISFGKK